MHCPEGVILATMNDWQIRTEFSRHLSFPQHIDTTNFRPVPHEDRIDEAHERQRLKQQ